MSITENSIMGVAVSAANLVGRFVFVRFQDGTAVHSATGFMESYEITEKGIFAMITGTRFGPIVSIHQLPELEEKTRTELKLFAWSSRNIGKLVVASYKGGASLVQGVLEGVSIGQNRLDAMINGKLVMHIFEIVVVDAKTVDGRFAVGAVVASAENGPVSEK